MIKTSSGIYPDFIYQPLFQDDIDDNYFMEEEDELSRKARNLGKKFSDFHKWADAMDVYNEYMELLFEKYHGENVLMNAIEAGLVDEMIPTKPKLKGNKRQNKDLLKMGKIPSKKIFTQTDYDLPYDFGRDVTGESITEEDSLKKNKLSKLTKKAFAEFERSRRQDNVFMSNGFGFAGRDFTYEYMDRLKSGNYSSVGEYTERGLSEMIKQEEMDALKEPWEIDREEGGRFKYIKGRWVDSSTDDTINVVKLLHQEGFNVMGSLQDGCSRQMVKMIKSAAGITEPLTEKEMKKWKKKDKKRRKSMEQRIETNAILEDILLSNKFDFKPDEFVDTDFSYVNAFARK